jgi:alpha,alpha-trehalase
MFLDYDGTLTPIVSDPLKAYLPVETRESLMNLAPRCYIAIITGRCVPSLFPETVCSHSVTLFLANSTNILHRQCLSKGCRSYDRITHFVDVPGLSFASSHGFDIHSVDPVFHHSVADPYLPALGQARDDLTAQLATIPGAAVEDNKFSVTIHYRNVGSQAQQQAVIDAVNSYVRAGDRAKSLVVRPGKMVVELRPAVEWHKGAAIDYIVRQLCQRNGWTGDSVAVLAVGDDHTDEVRRGCVWGLRAGCNTCWGLTTGN